MAHVGKKCALGLVGDVGLAPGFLKPYRLGLNLAVAVLQREAHLGRPPRLPVHGDAEDGEIECHRGRRHDGGQHLRARLEIKAHCGAARHCARDQCNQAAQCMAVAANAQIR